MSQILIVEDDAVLRDVLLKKLSKSGYSVEKAEDGEVALEKLRAGLKPDLILLDILMPKKNGMEVMEEMNADPVLKDIPIIIISNSGQPVEIERAKKLGAKELERSCRRERGGCWLLKMINFCASFLFASSFLVGSR